jgi:hypothetical protein
MSENAIDSEKRGQGDTLGSALFCTNSASATMRFCQNSKVFLDRVSGFATAETTSAAGYCPAAAVSDQATFRPSRRQAQFHRGSPALRAVSVGSSRYHIAKPLYAAHQTLTKWFN